MKRKTVAFILTRLALGAAASWVFIQGMLWFMEHAPAVMRPKSAAASVLLAQESAPAGCTTFLADGGAVTCKQCEPCDSSKRPSPPARNNDSMSGYP